MVSGSSRKPKINSQNIQPDLGHNKFWCHDQDCARQFGGDWAKKNLNMVRYLHSILSIALKISGLKLRPIDYSIINVEGRIHLYILVYISILHLFVHSELV